MKQYVLFNPLAGKGASEQLARDIAEGLGEGAVCLDMTATEDYVSLVAPLGEGDRVVIVGGDGTINRFVNATRDIELGCEVLYLAGGSGNDFLRDIEADCSQGPVDVSKYIKSLPSAEVGGRSYRFINNVGFGIDGYCCEVGDRMKAAGKKKINYTMIAIKGLLFHFKPCGATVTVDGQSYRYEKVWIAPTMKGRYYGGGMMPTPEQDRNDPEGTLSLMVFHGKGRIRTLMVFPSIFKGEHVKHTDMVAVHKGKSMCVTFDSPSTIQVDGETVTGITEYRADATADIGAAV